MNDFMDKNYKNKSRNSALDTYFLTKYSCLMPRTGSGGARDPVGQGGPGVAH